MKIKNLVVSTIIALGVVNVANVNAIEFTLTDTGSENNLGDWAVTNKTLGFTNSVDFSIEKRRLYGGKQTGVDTIIINNGKLTVTLIPTRGMGIFDVKMDGKRILGWDSPVKDIVNPAFIDLESRGGLGWLDGFNEMMVRCGYEWTGHPGIDDSGQLLSLHGRFQNTPASTVKVIINDAPPHKITIQGEVGERTFKKANLVTLTQFEIVPGSSTFSLHDELTNKSDYDDEYQIIYHSNFGSPILEKGAKFTAAASEISPFNDYAKKGMKDWETYLGPTKGYDEMVFNFKPIGDSKGNTLAVLHNSKGNKGVAVGYNIKQLPVLTLWKNTDTKSTGYVTGIEPGTSYAYSTKFQRSLGLVPTIKAGEKKLFDVTYTVLTSEKDVKLALKNVENIQKGNPIIKIMEPLVNLN